MGSSLLDSLVHSPLPFQALYYSTIIFRDGAQMSQDMAAGATLGIGVTMVIITLVSTATVDRYGRRALMLIGMAGMSIMSICLVITLHVMVSSSFQPYIDAMTSSLSGGQIWKPNSSSLCISGACLYFRDLLCDRTRYLVAYPKGVSIHKMSL